VVVPVNTTATVKIPAADIADITESGKPVQASEGVTFVGQGNGEATFAVGSGHYKFACISAH